MRVSLKGVEGRPCGASGDRVWREAENAREQRLLVNLEPAGVMHEAEHQRCSSVAWPDIIRRYNKRWEVK